MSEVQPKLIIHAGTGGSLKSEETKDAARKSLHEIVTFVYDLLLSGVSATEAVIRGCQLLEDEPRYNAGTGSVLQSDGQIRMSAGLMDGFLQRFSGVINVSRVQNPIKIAEFLQDETDRILSDFGAAELSRELNIPFYDPLTDFRLYEWIEERKYHFQKKMAGLMAEPNVTIEARKGTIGVVALDSQGRISAGTSTGGKGLERVGRVSDSATAAGNYANTKAGVSCTGVGEDIIDVCLAARIVIRVSDGFSLLQAMEKTFQESQEQKRDLAAIALDATGAIAWGKTCEALLAACHNGEKISDTIDLPKNELFGSF